MNIHLNDGSGIVEITAPTIILGTGGYSNVPNVPGLQEAGFLSSEIYLAISSRNNRIKSLAVLVQALSA